MANDEVRHAAETFVRQRVDEERAQVTAALDEAVTMEQALDAEFTEADDKYWELAQRNLDAEPSKAELDAQRRADALRKRAFAISASIESSRRKLQAMDDPFEFERRVRVKVEEIERRRRGKNGDDIEAALVVRTRVEIPPELIERILKALEEKTQREVADELNAEGLTTATGRPWTPQTIWNTIKKATGHGVPARKRR